MMRAQRTPQRPGSRWAAAWLALALLLGVARAETATNETTTTLDETRKPAVESTENSAPPEPAPAARPAVTNSGTEALMERLGQIQQALTDRQNRELESAQDANRLLLTALGGIAGVGFLGMLSLGWFQLRTMKHFTQVAAALPAGHGLVPAGTALLNAGGGPVPLTVAEQSSARVLNALEQLEKRIHDLGTLATPSLAAAGNGAESDAPTGPTEPAVNVEEIAAKVAATERAERLALLLAKGDALQKLEQVEPALACFAEVLALEPQHTEALLKQGTALEQLRRMDEALQCYDRALSIDSTITVAYLYKGGVFNRQERYREALECYELALQTQAKNRVSADSAK